jgi:hypothetical protein
LRRGAPHTVVMPMKATMSVLRSTIWRLVRWSKLATKGVQSSGWTWTCRLRWWLVVGNR